MKYLSLFSGIGGFELGIQQAYENSRLVGAVGQDNPVPSGQETLNSAGVGNTQASGSSDGSNGSSPICIGYSEIDKYAIQIYERHFPNHRNFGDITKITPNALPDFDLVAGGFPCQSFSIAGKRAGFSDTRGTLFFDIARIIREKQPRLVLLENVKGLLSHDQGRTFATIIATLDELGYDLQWQVLNSKDFGVPQNRERVFIIGHLRGTSRPQVFPFGDTAKKTIDSDEHFITESRVKHGKAPYKMNYSPTLSAHWGTGGNNVPIVNAIRRLTPVECARLQGFPDSWHEGISDTQAYKCYGNAVTVNVIKAIVTRLTI